MENGLEYVLALALENEEYRKIPLEDFVKALCDAEVSHLLEQGRPIGYTFELSKVLSDAFHSDFEVFSESEEKHLKEAFQKALARSGLARTISVSTTLIPGEEV